MTIDPLYKDCPKHWTALRFNLYMLMLKARHGWSDTSFNDLKAPASVKCLTEAVRATASVKATINRDLLTEANGLPASVKPYCPPRLNFV
jgi:hypothetical protein